MSWESLIGLEVHVELNTETKLFCSCKNRFGGAANTRVCPVCTGAPGTLPTLNRAAVRAAILAGLAFGCEIRTESQWARKHYAYPDLPKGYQISQDKLPLCYNGAVEFLCEGERRRVRIRQIHLEEDAGKLIHEGEETRIDYNRCGVPLIEIVTEPDLRSAAEARAFLEQVRLTLLYLGVSDCRMQEGSLRCDVNVSLRKSGDTTLGPRVEMKNINTFSGAARAIVFEIARQTALLERGDTVAEETRRWDDERRQSVLLRDKESAEDYRFFPEPDIPPLRLREKERAMPLPELPLARYLRYRNLNISETDATLIVASPDTAHKLDHCLLLGAPPGQTASLLLNLGVLGETLAPKQITDALRASADGVISKTAERRVLEYLSAHPETTVEHAIDALGVRQVRDDAQIKECIRAVLLQNRSAVSDYRAGKKNAFGFLVGQCMRMSDGRLDPRRLQEILRSELDGHKE